MRRCSWKVLVCTVIALPPMLSCEVFSQPSPWVLPTSSVRDSNIVIYNFDKHETTIIELQSRFEFIYQPDSPQTAEQIAKRYGFRLAINGSYFENSSKDGKPCFPHAGLLRMYGALITPMKEDRQLTHLVNYDPLSRILKFFPRGRGYPVVDKPSIQFQTGPLVIENDTVASSWISGSINGKTRHRRTLLAASAFCAHFIIVRAEATLDEIAEFLRSCSLLRSRYLSVMNLDGGPSTALWSRDHPELNFNSERSLPIWLGVK